MDEAAAPDIAAWLALLLALGVACLDGAKVVYASSKLTLFGHHIATAGWGLYLAAAGALLGAMSLATASVMTTHGKGGGAAASARYYRLSASAVVLLVVVATVVGGVLHERSLLKSANDGSSTQTAVPAETATGSSTTASSAAATGTTATSAAPAAQATTTIATVPCGTYSLGMAATVTARLVPCKDAIAIVHAFQSSAAVEHAGQSMISTYWTLPAFPGWRCAEGAGGGACTLGAAEAQYALGRWLMSVGAPCWLGRLPRNCVATK